MDKKWLLSLLAITVVSVGLAGCTDNDESTEDSNFDSDPGQGTELGQQEPGEDSLGGAEGNGDVVIDG